jgi:starch synthase
VGILNGIDYSVWNPEIDPMIEQTYSADDLAGKARCKASLQRMFGLKENPAVPVVSMVTRLSSQKGVDLLENAIGPILASETQFVLLGSGEKRYGDMFSRLLGKYPGKAGVQVAFDEPKTHSIIAGADILLVPSRYEPCGLTQLQALRYGTIPVARATGGLKNTIQEFNPETGEGNGFLFGPYAVPALLDAVERALALYRQDKKWNVLVRNAMKADFSWEKSARVYSELYRMITARG